MNGFEPAALAGVRILDLSRILAGPVKGVVERNSPTLSLPVGVKFSSGSSTSRRAPRFNIGRIEP